MNAPHNPYAPPHAPPGSDAPYNGVTPPAADDVSGVSNATIDLLRQTRPWVTFLSVFTFLFSGLLILGGVLVSIAGAAFGGAANSVSPMIFLAYVPVGLLYVYPGIKLWSFGAAISRLSLSRNARDLDAALGEQKSFWKFTGITCAIIVGIYMLIFVGIIAAGVLSATRPK